MTCTTPFEKRLNITADMSTPYMVSTINLSHSAGLVVLTVPPGPSGGIINDLQIRNISDTGLAGPDQGAGGNYRYSPHLSRQQYARIVDGRVSEIGLDPTLYGIHSLRRTKASLIYRRTKNIRAVQLLLGHTELESTARYLGFNVDDAVELSEQIEV